MITVLVAEERGIAATLEKDEASSVGIEKVTVVVVDVEIDGSVSDFEVSVVHFDVFEIRVVAPVVSTSSLLDVKVTISVRDNVDCDDSAVSGLV